MLIMYLYIIKGSWSIFSSASVGYYYDWMGFVDMTTGISLLFAYYNVYNFNIFGVIMIIKGLFCLFSLVF
ncbi:MAG: hypothetical protein OH319_01110 [Candidatus Parvarchaeota archaeon]|nr:hypothetical protein [Candidatus Jingweiarchaeum tengchongense]MCW1297826.1 hypothetical protein [Candidatus Jingweiarchaeum tengchongense]MCW1299837.1 hypothetical protein [Candidatus Jingweiarchaeum tengchongense]MCW1304193.1 hypothetical protein [Candidatus Jingweiarchaeum tengchongense]